MNQQYRVALWILTCLSITGCAQHPVPQPTSLPSTNPIVILSPAELPGRGISQHDFLYAGETERRRPTQTISLVRGGQVVWTYTMPHLSPTGLAQEFSDATMLPNGNIVIARETGAMEVTPDKRVIWNYDAPKGCEVHAAQPIDADRVFLMQNGTPAMAMIVNTATGKIEKQVAIPAGMPAHTQFRHARLTADGTILAPQLKDGKVVEYDWNGNILWAVAAPDPWAAIRLKNGDTLISLEHNGLREVNPLGQTVWEFTQADVPDITLLSTQEATRLANGNTLFCNWVSGRVPLDQWRNVVQVLEVTPDKKVVWALHAWQPPADLGPATSVQLLDEPGASEQLGQIQR